MKRPLHNPRRFIVWLILFALVMGVFLFPMAVRADSDYTFDFTVSDGGWTVASWGQYVSSTGWWVTSSNYSVGIHYLLPDGTHITSMTVTAYDPGDSIDWFDIGLGKIDSYHFHGTSFVCGNNKNGGVETLGGHYYRLTMTCDHVAASADYLVADWGGHTQGGNYITSITVNQAGLFAPTPTPTPTFTSTPPPPTSTPPPAPPITGGYLGETCNLLGLRSATFTGLGQPGDKWTLRPGDTLFPGNPAPSQTGLFLPEGSATQPLLLDPSQQYSIHVVFHAQTAIGETDAFNLALGQKQTTISIPDSTSSQVFDSSPESIQPSQGTDLYDLTFSKTLHSLDPALVVDYVCISQKTVTSSGATAPTAGLVAITCKNCTYRPVGDLIQDVPLLIGWIGCIISNLWNCAAKTLLNGIWASIVALLTSFAFLFKWISVISERGIPWLLGNTGIVATWVNSVLGNLIVGILNGIISVLKSLGLIGFFQDLAAFAIGIPATLLTFISLIGAVASTIWEIARGQIGRLVSLLGQLISFIPGLIVAIVTGFNTTNTLPAWAAACTNSNSLLYFPCLGMYVLDNTLFDGPFYFIIPAVEGFIGTFVVIWSIRRFARTAERS